MTFKSDVTQILTVQFDHMLRDILKEIYHQGKPLTKERLRTNILIFL